MRRLVVLLLFVVACGDGEKAGMQGDDEVVSECHDIPQPDPDPFPTSASLDSVIATPVIPGTLHDWDPNGRWFLTGTRVGGVSSYQFERNGNSVVVDRDATAPGTIDDDVLFQRGDLQVSLTTYKVIKRVSNRAADGSLRAERVLCDGEMCRVCTAKVIRATHNADEGEGEGLTLLGQLNDPAWPQVYTLNVRVVGTTAYMVRRDGLYIIDVADPTHPVQLGHYGRPVATNEANDIKLVDAGPKRYAFIADVPVDIVDVTDPANPVLAGQIAEEAHTLAVESRDNKVYAYFGDYNAYCPIYDVTNPLTPTKLGTFHTGGQLVHDLSIENGIAYLNAWNGGFYVVDYTTPSTPRSLGRWPTTPTATSHSNWTTTVGGRHIALHGEENYAAHLDVVDVDPTSSAFMSSIGSYKTRDWVSIHNIMAFGSKAYFTYYQDGVRVVDVSDPTMPKQVGYYNTWDPQADYTTSGFFEGAVGLDVDVARKLVFVADSPRGLLILQDSTP